MSMKHAIGWFISTAATAVVAGAAFYIGMKEGQRQVVNKVDDIRSQVRCNPGMDLDDALDAQLTDEAGNYVMTPAQKSDMTDCMMIVGGIALMTSSVASVVMGDACATDAINTMSKRYDETVDAMANWTECVIEQSCNSFNTIADQHNAVNSAIRALPEGPERDTMLAYKEGLRFGADAMNNGVHGKLRTDGLIRDWQPGDPSRY